MVFSKRRVWAACTVLVLLAFLAGYWFLSTPPRDFPVNTIVLVPQGASAGEVAEELQAMRVIKYPLMLRLIWRLQGTGSTVQSGAYRFQSAQNAFTVARRLAVGAYDMPAVRLTFFEGITAREMAEQITAAFPQITESQFVSAAKPLEGYLFPDTYFFMPTATTSDIVSILQANFDAKIKLLAPEIAASGHSLSDIVIMASLIEKEARTTANRRIVAGVLWNRLEKDMPFQVDAVFGYIMNRDTFHPSAADLQVDSPYNTYQHRGLPPGPINNPGLDALEAAIHPTKTKYFYYLTDPEGVMHYAVTYAEHQANQKKYLK